MPRTTPQRFDVLIATDLRFPGGTTASVAEEVRAQERAGFTTGLLHMPSPIQRDDIPMAPRIRQLVESAAAELVLAGPVTTKLLVVRHPSVLSSPPAWLPEVSAEEVLVVVNQVPEDDRAREPYYDVMQCHRVARKLARSEPVWAPIGPTVRKALEPYVDQVPLMPEDWTNIIDVEAWHTPRTGFAADRPVIGRHTRGHWTKWPADRETLLAAYPEDPAYRVEVLGGTQAPRDVLGHLPANWVDHPFNSKEPAEFLSGVDFLVYYHHPGLIEAFGRTVLEGVAAGAVAIVDPSFAATFGPACLYTDPGDVRSVIDRLYADRDAYLRQSAHGVEYVRQNFSYEAHARRLRQLIGAPSGQGRASPPAASTEPDHVLIVTDPVRPAVANELIKRITAHGRPAEGAAPVILCPAHAAGSQPEGAYVETVPAVAQELPVEQRDRYVQSRIAELTEAYPGMREVVLADTARSAVTGSVPFSRAEVVDSSGTWRLSPIPSVARGHGRSLAQLLTRGSNLARQHAPATVVKLGVRIKRALRATGERAMGQLAPAGALLVTPTSVPRLPIPVSPVERHRPTAVFVVTDPEAAPERIVPRILTRAVLSNAFRPVLLAPLDWLPYAEQYGLAIETIARQYTSGSGYTAAGARYVRYRTAQAVQVFQPAAVIPVGSATNTAEGDVDRALDLGEVLCAQRRSQPEKTE